jgi:4-hydroxybenzoate polyprenyltransferase
MSILKRYLSLIKFSHTIFAMPFAMVGFGLGIIDQAARSSSLPMSQWIWKGFGVLGCMVFARSAAMAFNRYLDRKIDAMNPRTAMREIPAGIISPQKALWFTVLNAGLFVCGAFWINMLCFYLSPLALLIVLGYSYTKRFTALCHLILGLGLSLSVTGAYLAVTGEFGLLPILFSAAVLTWVSGFDIIYAMQDESFDRSHRLHSIPAWLGGKRALQVSSVLHVITIAFLFFAGIWSDYGFWYWAGTLVFSGLLIYQHALVTAEDLSRVNLAFMTTNGVGSVVFSVFVMLEWIFSN